MLGVFSECGFLKKKVQFTNKKNSLPLLNGKLQSGQNKKKKILAVSSDVCLFHFYISCSIQNGDLDEIFALKNHSWPSSLSNYSKL